MEKRNILLLSNSPNLYFGYSVVFSQVAKYISKAGHNLYYLGMQTFGEPTRYDNYNLLSIRSDPWGSDSLEDYIDLYEIDLVITALDIWMPNMGYINEIFSRKKNVQWIHHITANSEPLSPYIIRNITNADKVVAPSKYNRDLLLNAGFKNVEYIPHFVDTKIFNKDKEKRNEFRKYLGLDDKFVFVAVMRNRDLHKNPAALLKAYKQFLIEVPEARDKTRLVFVCDPKENGGTDLVALRSALKLDDNVIFPKIKIKEGKPTPTLETEPNAIPYSTSIAFGREQMSGIYNASDVHINTSSGESFGLPILESMACGCLQIVHEATTGKELVSEPLTGITVPTSYKFTMNILSDICLIDINSLKEVIKQSYIDYDKDYIQDFINNGLKFSKGYEKKKIMKQWTDLVTQRKPIAQVNYTTGELGI